MKLSEFLFLFFIIVVVLFVTAFGLTKYRNSENSKAKPKNPGIGTNLIPNGWKTLSNTNIGIFTFPATLNSESVNGVTESYYITPTPTLNENALKGKTLGTGGCFYPDQIAVQQNLLSCTGYSSTSTFNNCVNSSGQTQSYGSTATTYGISTSIQKCGGQFGVLSLNLQTNNCNQPYTSCINFGCLKNSQGSVLSSYPCSIVDTDQLISIDLVAFKRTSILFRNTNSYLDIDRTTTSLTYSLTINGSTGTPIQCQNIDLNITGQPVLVSKNANSNWYYFPGFSLSNIQLECSTQPAPPTPASYPCSNSELNCPDGYYNKGSVNIPPQLVYVGNVDSYSSSPLVTQSYNGVVGPQAVINYILDNKLQSLYSLQGISNNPNVMLLPFCDNNSTMCSMRNNISFITNSSITYTNQNIPTQCIAQGYTVTFLPFVGFNDSWV